MGLDISRIFTKSFESERVYPPAAFKKSSAQIREMYQTKGKGELHSAIFKRVLKIQKVCCHVVENSLF